MKSLYDSLHLVNPAEPGKEPAPLPKKMTAKAFCQAILNSPEFRTYLLNGIVLGDLPPQVITKIMDHGWGKPVERLEIDDRTNRVEDATGKQLEDRAAFLLQRARQIRMNDEVPQTTEEDGGPEPSSIH